MYLSGKTKKKPKHIKKQTKRQTKKKDQVSVKSKKKHVKKPVKKPAKNPLKKPMKKPKKKTKKQIIKNELNNLSKPETKLERMDLVDYLENKKYNRNKDLDLQLAIHLAKQEMKNETNRRQKQKNILNLKRFLELDELRKKALKKQEQLEKEQQEQEYANNLNVNLIEYASLAKPIKLRLDKNPRVYFINGHSIACPSQPIDLKLYSTFSSFEGYKLLQMQSLGRMNASDVTILLAKLLESNPKFYEYFISLETDGDVEKFKKLFTKYAYSSSQNDFLKYKRWAMQFRTKNIADFEIYPKPANPELQQVPFTKKYIFYPNNVMEKYPMGVYEVTRLNPLTGRFEMDPFLFSDELHNIFLGQKNRAKESGSMLEIIKVGLLIPDKITERLILEVGGKEYLEKINRLNKINRLYFQSKILKSKELDLRIERATMRFVLTQILYDVEETTPDNEILVLDNSCNAFPVLEKNKKNKKKIRILNQYENPNLTNNFKEMIKMFRPKRSKSRENEQNNYNFEL